MKNLFTNILLGLVLVGLISSCEDYLEPKVNNPYGDEFTFENARLAEGLLMNAYTNIPNQVDNYSNNFLDVATDNALTNDFGSDIYTLGGGNISSTDSPIGLWSKAYNNFSYINLFIEKCLDTTQVIYSISNKELDSQTRKRLTGEAYFLRAFWGMELLRVYGGVAEDGSVLGYPIITRFMTEDELESSMLLGRNTYEECVSQILEDCDSAIANLPIKYPDNDGDPIVVGSASIGRASGAAAYVLKSRAATFAASPAFNGGTNVTEKWERAARLSQVAIDSAGLKYQALQYSDVVTPVLKNTPTEYLFRSYHNNNSIEKRNLPFSHLGNGYTNPSQNLVDAFPMSNGYPITHPSSGYNPQTPYVNRDLRLKNTVIYNGQPVESGGRGLEVSSYIIETVIEKIDTVSATDDGFGNMIYDIDTTFITVERKGIDAPGFNYRNTRTGYYLRKWVSDKAEMLKLEEMKNSEHAYPIIRAAEAFHNLAEALNEAAGPTGAVDGCNTTAYEVIADIRTKSLGLSTDEYLLEITTKDKMRELLQNERRIEFAFENHRYFNLRRWKLPLNEAVRGMKVTQDITGTYTFVGTDPSDLDSQIELEERNFDGERYYYHPLPYSELTKCPALVNNKGW